MPSPATLAAFIAEVEAGRFVEAIEAHYGETASMRENNAEPRVGRDVLVEGEKRTLARSAKATATLLDPPLVTGDRVALHWLFEFTRPDGKVVRLDEIAWQRWEGERIVEERFFYDPAQMAPA
jgi:hypothetical protein